MSLAKVRNSYKTRVKCSEQGCALKTGGLDCVIIDSQAHQKPGAKMCDCIVVADCDVMLIGVCELKSGSYKPQHVRAQLEGGIQLAEDICKTCFGSCGYRIVPILLTNHTKRIENTMISRTKVYINGKKYAIQRKNCGIHLSQFT